MTGCSLTDAKSAAEEEITKFHENYNGSNFKLIYNNFHSDLKKKNSSFEDFSEFITTVHNKLGLVSSTTNQA